MTVNQEQYDEIMARKVNLQYASCSCHISPPCWVCMNQPSEEELAACDQFEKLMEE